MAIESRWFRVPLVGSGVKHPPDDPGTFDPQRAKYSELADGHSRFIIGNSGMAFMRAFGEPSTLDEIQAKEDAQPMPFDIVASAFNEEFSDVAVTSEEELNNHFPVTPGNQQ